MNAKRHEATMLRNAGYSYSLISKRLGIPKSTLSGWFSDVPFTPNNEVIKRIKHGPIIAAAKSHNARVEETLRLRELGANELGPLSKRDLWLLGIGLYIGEGAKTIESIRIANSDPKVIAIAVRWFKDICSLTNENIMIRLHLYPDNDENECKEYWQKISGLPIANFQKTSVDTRTNKSATGKRKLPYGTAHLRIVSKGNPDFGVRLYRRINGWVAGALQQL